jgi:hypothetical protein
VGNEKALAESGSAAVAELALCYILVRFLCSGKPFGVLFSLGAETECGVDRSLISPMNADAIEETPFDGRLEGQVISSPSSDKSSSNRCPRKAMAGGHLGGGDVDKAMEFLRTRILRFWAWYRRLTMLVLVLRLKPPLSRPAASHEEQPRISFSEGSTLRKKGLCSVKP